MNNVNDLEASPEFIDDQRFWLLEYKGSTGYSWSKLERPIGRPGSTLSMFCSGTYNKSAYEGGNAKIAADVYRYRQTLNAQVQMSAEIQEDPPYYETRTSREFTAMCVWAHRGRMGMIATNPGMGKTKTFEEYQQCASNVFIITCRPSIKTITGLCTVVLFALGNKHARGSAERLSQWVMTEVRHKGALLIFDDAQHLSIEHIEEIRGWFDQTNVGVVFAGNHETISRMEGGGTRSMAFAQLSSRIGMKFIRNQPLDEDVESLAVAWGVEHEGTVAYLKMISKNPGALRTCSQVMGVASLIAGRRGEQPSRDDLAQAWSQRSSQPLTV